MYKVEKISLIDILILNQITMKSKLNQFVKKIHIFEKIKMIEEIHKIF